MCLVRFAHVSDIHVASYQEEFYVNKEWETIHRMVDICLEEKVDFLVVSGDLFHTNLPRMSEAVRLTRELRRLRDEGVRIYCVYGSHDSSPTRTSLIEVLAADKLLCVLDRRTVDESGAVLNGMHGLAGAKEAQYYQSNALEPGPGGDTPSVFVFHTAVTEAAMVPQDQSIPMSSLPSGYSYYAAGHLHKRIELSYNGSPLNYPGPLYLGYGLNDLEAYLRRPSAGFYIVDFDPRPKFRFIELKPLNGSLLEFDATGMSDKRCVAQVTEEVKAESSKLEPGSLLLIKVFGQLSTGGRSAVSTSLEKLRRSLAGLEVRVNDNMLTDSEDPPIEAGEDLEERFLKKMSEVFPGGADVEFIQKLLDTLSRQKAEGTVQRDYEEAVYSEVLSMLKSKGVLIEDKL